VGNAGRPAINPATRIGGKKGSSGSRVGRSVDPMRSPVRDAFFTTVSHGEPRNREWHGGNGPSRTNLRFYAWIFWWPGKIVVELRKLKEGIMRRVV
jgi:hypothetical protein